MATLGSECRVGVIGETPITIIQDPEYNGCGSRKSVVFLHRTQAPPAGPLREEWSLKAYGLRGSWGYVFRYNTGELCLYQLNDGEVLKPDRDMAVLSSNDWGVLRAVNPKNLAEHEEEIPGKTVNTYP